MPDNPPSDKPESGKPQQLKRTPAAPEDSPEEKAGSKSTGAPEASDPSASSDPEGASPPPSAAPEEQGAPPPPPSGSEEGTAPPPTPQSSNRTLMLVLSYFGPFALIPLLVEKEDPEIQWHAKNGLLFVMGWIVLSIALFVVAQIPFVGWLLGCAVGFLLPLAILGIHIYAMVKAVNGERLRLPVVSDFADQWR